MLQVDIQRPKFVCVLLAHVDRFLHGSTKDKLCLVIVVLELAVFAEPLLGIRAG